MSNKKLIRTSLLFLALSAGALVYLYAREKYLLHHTETVEKLAEQETGNSGDTGILTGDDPWQEMKKLVSAYYDKEGVLFKGNIKLIDDNGDQEKIMEEYPFEYAVMGEEFQYSLDKMEFIRKKDLVMVVDHANKFISLSTETGIAGKPSSFFDITEFKRLMEERKATAKVTQLGTLKILTLENILDPQVNGYSIYYDPQTYHISKMLVGMVRFSSLDSREEDGIEDISREDEVKEIEEPGDQEIETDQPGIDTYTYYVEINYTDSRLLNIKPGAFHPESKFFRVIDNKIELLPVFSSYELANNAETQKDTTVTSEEK